MSLTQTLTLELIWILDRFQNVRSATDERYAVDRVLCEYKGSDGRTYRKDFEIEPGSFFQPPLSGTHKELNALRRRYIEDSDPQRLVRWDSRKGVRS